MPLNIQSNNYNDLYHQPQLVNASLTQLKQQMHQTGQFDQTSMQQFVDLKTIQIYQTIDQLISVWVKAQKETTKKSLNGEILDLTTVPMQLGQKLIDQLHQINFIQPIKIKAIPQTMEPKLIPAWSLTYANAIFADLMDLNIYPMQLINRKIDQLQTDLNNPQNVPSWGVDRFYEQLIKIKHVQRLLKRRAYHQWQTISLQPNDTLQQLLQQKLEV